MQYKSFKIVNYKGIENIDLELKNNRILTLVGLNESGKTTILQALDLFYKLLKGKNPSNLELQAIRPKGTDFSGSIKISATANLDNDDKILIQNKWETIGKKTILQVGDQISWTFEFNYEDHVFRKRNNNVTFSIKSKTAKKGLFQTDKPGWQELMKFIRENEFPEILFYEDFIFEIPEKILYSLDQTKSSPFDDLVLSDLNHSWQSVLDDILSSVQKKSVSFHERIVKLWLIDRDTANARILQMEKMINTTITESWKDLFKDGGQKLNFKQIRLICEQRSQYLEVSMQVITDNNLPFSLNERSKGCKWFFSFLLFTEFRKNRSNNILFLLDEPASNLHSKAQSKILNAISDLSDKSMVAYSTHSHHLIRPQWLSGTYVVMNENQSDKSLEGDMTFEDKAKISAIPYFNYIGKGLGVTKMSYCQPILDILDYSRSEVEPVPNIVITEGKNDWFTFEYINNVVGLNKIYDFKFYPGAGKDQLWEIIRIYLSWGAPFVVLLDGDIGGQKAKKAYIKEFGDFISHRIYTLEDILGQYFVTEDMFSEMEKDDIITTALGANTKINKNPSVYKSIFNQTLGILAFNKTQISISTESKKNFIKLFKILEKSLLSQSKN